MKTKDLIQHIATSTSMTKTHTEELLNATVAVMQKELLAGKSTQTSRQPDNRERKTRLSFL